MAIDYTKNAVTGEPLTPYQRSFDPGNVSATNPAKNAFVSNIAKKTSPGSYKGIPITGGTDADIAKQVSAIDANNAGVSPSTYNTPAALPTNNPNQTPANVPTEADTAFADYLKSLQESPETKAATEYVNNLVLQGKKDQETALNTGETLGFATGEAARVGKNNAFALEAATNALNALTNSNASKATIAKARSDYETAKLKAAKDAEPAPFDLSPGQKRYAYDAKTGTYKEVASVPAAPKSVTAADRNATIMSDVNQAVSQLGTIVKTKGFRGVSPDDYNTMRQYLQDAYGVDGVIELDKAMKALGLTVDVDWAKLDAKIKK